MAKAQAKVAPKRSGARLVISGGGLAWQRRAYGMTEAALVASKPAIVGDLMFALSILSDVQEIACVEPPASIVRMINRAKFFISRELGHDPRRALDVPGAASELHRRRWAELLAGGKSDAEAAGVMASAGLMLNSLGQRRAAMPGTVALPPPPKARKKGRRMTAPDPRARLGGAAWATFGAIMGAVIVLSGKAPLDREVMAGVLYELANKLKEAIEAFEAATPTEIEIRIDPEEES